MRRIWIYNVCEYKVTIHSIYGCRFFLLALSLSLFLSTFRKATDR